MTAALSTTQTSDPQTLDPQTLDPQTLDPQMLDPRTSDPRTSDPRTSSPQRRVQHGLVGPPTGRPPLRIVVRPAPRREPPFDDEIAEPTPARAWDQPLPFTLVPPAPARPPAPLRPVGLPDPELWGRRLLVGLIECADGRRPLNQLAALLSLSVARGLGSEFERAAQLRASHWLHRAAVNTVRVCEPASGVAELSATLHTGARVRAVAIRLETQQGRWRCTRLQLG